MGLVGCCVLVIRLLTLTLTWPCRTQSSARTAQNIVRAGGMEKRHTNTRPDELFNTFVQGSHCKSQGLRRKASTRTAARLHEITARCGAVARHITWPSCREEIARMLCAISSSTKSSPRYIRTSSREMRPDLCNGLQPKRGRHTITHAHTPNGRRREVSSVCLSSFGNSGVVRCTQKSFRKLRDRCSHPWLNTKKQRLSLILRKWGVEWNACLAFPCLAALSVDTYCACAHRRRLPKRSARPT